MDTAHWEQGDEFAVLDLVAQFQFKSPTSVSFRLGKHISHNSPPLLEMRAMDAELMDYLTAPGSVFVVIGWLDGHHPCDGFHRLQLRVGLPDRYVCWESMRDMVPQVLAALNLPNDESYHMVLAGLSQQISTEEPQSGFVS